MTDQERERLLDRDHEICLIMTERDDVMTADEYEALLEEKAMLELILMRSQKP